MKVINTAFGTAVVNVAIDDVAPTYGLGQGLLVETVKNLYQFNVFPQMRPGAQNLPALIFQNGTFLDETQKHAIAQLTISPDGDGVITNHTDSADAILTNYIGHMNNDLGYRYTGDEPRHYYSIVVVEFDFAFSERIAALEAVQKTVSKAMAGALYQLKTLTFELNANESAPSASIMQMVPSDFVIDRRASAPFEKNRFYCSAPLKTGDHIYLLQEIENTISEAR